MREFVENILYHYSYPVLFLISFLYFSFLYFGVGHLYLGICKLLEHFDLAHKILTRKLKKGQINSEIKNSLVSVFTFGLSIIPIVYLIRIGSIQLIPNSFKNITIGLAVLSIYNELHFYLIHRLLHTSFFMRKVHFLHHRSVVPTIYSIYSFHWFEGFLLSTVPLTLAPFFPLPIVAIFAYPFLSVIINYAGHCNYRLGNGKTAEWKRLATNHSEHHSKGKLHFGFALNIFDKLFNKTKH